MLFIKIVNMTLTASYCILAVLAARLVLRRAPKKYAYLLWLVVAFRLCCPVSIHSSFSLFNLGFFEQGVADGNTMTYLNEDAGIQQESENTTGLSIFWENTESNQWDIGPEGSQRDAFNSIHPIQVWSSVGTLLWLAGVVVMLLCGLGSYLLLRRRLRNAVLLRENIYQSEHVCSPFILGFLRPCIYIPFGLEERTLELVLAHERYHLHRRDHWVKLAGYLLLALHWFNPLCWVAFFLMGRDMEMSCDEHVLAQWERSCKPYCNALLFFASNRRSWGPSPLAFGESGAKGRIRNALRWKKPGTWVKVAAVGICLLTMTACGLNPTSAQAQSVQDTPPGADQGDVSGMEPGYVSDAAQGKDYMEDVRENLTGEADESNRELIMSTEGVDGIWIRTSGGKEYGIGWTNGVLVSQERKTTGLDFYGAEKIQLEVSWECEQLEARVEYYDVTDTGSVLTEQREMTLPKENGMFTFELTNIYDKLPEKGQEVRIYFDCDGEECLVGGMIPLQGKEQKELESEATQYFQGLIRNITDREIVVDQKMQINDGNPEWETWAAQWDPNGHSDGRAVIDLAYEDLRAMVSEECQIVILDNHWQPERNISWEELPAYIEDCPWNLLWNFTVEGNQITEIKEQYLP